MRSHMAGGISCGAPRFSAAVGLSDQWRGRLYGSPMMIVCASASSTRSSCSCSSFILLLSFRAVLILVRRAEVLCGRGFVGERLHDWCEVVALRGLEVQRCGAECFVT